MDEIPSDAQHAQAAQSLATVWSEHYPEQVLAELAGRYTSEPVTLAHERTAPDTLRALVEAHPDISGALLALRSLEMGRDRAENVRRQALLGGLGNIETGLTVLVQNGLVVMVPEPGQRGWTLAEEIETRRFLQRELVWTEPLLGWMHHVLDLEAARQELGGLQDDDIVALPGSSVDTLELNLLHLASALHNDTLILNKDGSPNRRSLARFLKGLILPGRTLSDEPDPMEPADYEAAFFLLAIGLRLELLQGDAREITGHSKGLKTFFTADESTRDRRLTRAYRSCDRWSEFEAHMLLERSSLTFDQGRRAALGTSSDWASRFSGVRGQVFSDLNKLPWSGWADVDAVVERLLALDRGYLVRALETEIDSVDAPALFLRSVLMTALPWLGMARTGQTQDDRQVIALTPRGRRMLRIDPPSKATLVQERPPPFMVLPNFEVTVFRDAVSLESLYTLYRVGERISLADRVAMFRMTAETVQRGYSDGLSAEGLIAFLNSNTRVPIPNNIAFTLGDWERIHQKITLYARGTVLQYPDPDVLDLELGTLQHYWKPDDPLVSLSSTDAFLPTLDLSVVSRVFDLEQAHIIDYTQQLPPCLQQTGELTFAPLPTGLDFITRAELDRFADPVGQPEWPDAWTLNVTRARAYWGEEEAISKLLHFLKGRLEGGVPASLELRLLTLFGEDASATIERDVVLVRVSSAHVCNALSEVPEVEEHIIERLGETVLYIDANGIEAVQTALTRLGLD